MQCKHYKDSGYEYSLNEKESIRLCEQCEMNLYAEMTKQAAIELKAQTVCNKLYPETCKSLQSKRKK